MKTPGVLIYKSKDGESYFAFAKKYPAAAVSAPTIPLLFDRLRTALIEVMKQEELINSKKPVLLPSENLAPYIPGNRPR